MSTLYTPLPCLAFYRKDFSYSWARGLDKRWKRIFFKQNKQRDWYHFRYWISHPMEFDKIGILGWIFHSLYIHVTCGIYIYMNDTASSKATDIYQICMICTCESYYCLLEDKEYPCNDGTRCDAMRRNCGSIKRDNKYAPLVWIFAVLGFKQNNQSQTNKVT